MYFTLSFIQKFYKVGFLSAFILILADLLTFFYYPNTLFGDIFLATREQTPLTWFSSLAFLFIALSCVGVYLKQKERIWYFLALVFFFFSMDDAIYFHERVSGFFQDNTEVFAFFPSYIWVILYLPILLFSLVAFMYFTWKYSDRKTKKLLILAVFLLGSAFLLDFIDGLVLKDSSLVFCIERDCHRAVTHIFRLVEEAFEVFALGIFGYLHLMKYNLLQKKD